MPENTATDEVNEKSGGVDIWLVITACLLDKLGGSADISREEQDRAFVKVGQMRINITSDPPRYWVEFITPEAGAGL